MEHNEYEEFVDSVTSNESRSTECLVERIDNLQSQGLDVARVLTAAVGMANEAGEFGEIIKKMLFQGKELTPENREKMKSELGDVLWYFTQALIALGFTMEEIRDGNYAKLGGPKGRYKDGFSAEASENRKE